MSRQPFIFVPDRAGSDIVRIDGVEARHLIKTLRARPGFIFTIFDGKGHQILVEVSSISSGEITARVVRELPDETLPATKIIVATAIIKGSRMDYAVEKAAETGANKFIPLLTDRIGIPPGSKKLKRWREIAKSAAKQSRRAHLMDISEPAAISTILRERSYAAIVLSPSLDSCKFAEKIANLSGAPLITLFIGPEGGFSELEIRLLQKWDIPFCRLAQHTLRTETAVAVSIGIARAILQESHAGD